MAAGNQKKALLIGCNYRNTVYNPSGKGALSGCTNDVRTLYGLLTGMYGYAPANVRVLVDDAASACEHPTRSNIVSAIGWLVADAQPGDRLVFQFSGHGSQIDDESGDEQDGLDETICPADYQTAGMISDDTLHELLCEPLPRGCHLTAVMDCCHSGTGLDLVHEFRPADVKLDGKHADKKQKKLEKKLARAADKKAAKKDKKKDKKKKKNSDDDDNDKKKEKKKEKKKDKRKLGETKADVVLFSGCRDDQTSADAVIAGKNTGAMTYALAASIQHQQDVSYKNLLESMNAQLRGVFSQRPQLSTGRELNLEDRFSF